MVLPTTPSTAPGAPPSPPAWLERLQERLPPGQRGHLVEVVEKPDELVLFVDRAAWAGRIRLALPELAEVAGGRRLTIRLKVMVRERQR